MRRILFVTILMLYSFINHAETPKNTSNKLGAISGVIIDINTKQALPYVNIVIRDANHQILTGGITDDKGEFSIKKITEGKNTIEIQYIGYKPYVREVDFTSKNSTHKLGTVELEENTEVLGEVVVRAELSTVTQKIDRKVINVGKDLTAAGATASEVLNNVQSVSVDSQTGTVSLRGNENVRILVDGKPTNISAAQLLQQIPSTSIKSVELITNPSAKYNPEGMSGIINIVLNKNANIGFNGNVNLGVTRGVNTRGNGSLDMNYKTGAVNFFMNFGANGGKRNNYGEVTRYLENENGEIIQNFEFNSDNNSQLLKVGADIYLNKKNTLSFYTTQNFRDGVFDGTTKILRGTDLDYHSLMKSETENSSGTYNLNYKIDFEKEGHNLEFEATYSQSNSPEDATYTELLNPIDLTSNYIDDINNDYKNTLLNLDYTNPLSENTKLEFGLEFRLNDTENSRATNQHDFVYDNMGNMFPDGDWYVTEQKPNSAFTYDRSIYSGYVNLNHKIDEFSMQLGARIEQYEVDGEFIKGDERAKYNDSKFTVYPSAFFTFTPSEKHQFQLSFSRRVDRPSIQQVNPIREWSTPLISSFGNPSLKPQFTNSFEFNYTKGLAKGSVTLGTFYRRVNDNISRVLNIDPLDIEKMEMSYYNTESNDRYGLELSANYRFFKWWSMNASSDLYVQKETGVANGENLEVTNNSFNVRVSNSFTATKKLKFQLFAMYRGGGKDLQSEVDPMWMINTGASYSVLKGKGTLTFRVNDIFEGMKYKFDSEVPYNQVGEFHWESRTAYLGFSYRFGSGKNKAKRRKQRDSRETQGGGGFM
ncbi:TonB-dependent receptor [Ancylomarina euxinus]|uniref:TonB-dependent receptor n=1 Tax=Ancylomarina euxinus TaxID=2283627 RepID=A0A425Y1K1_9BACT|nr:outer membrane beta-barrel family protein [Ancylomarina euxinus]MCZ4695135.1 outer membrane beta-barrel family protein [Ancylomarina euxinus]MUP14929.1 TonB-dependent receptor [Ancylomarina euxinus]RRG21824.1 TonB-dependent receptor [Ancylomarina euxinus]